VIKMDSGDVKFLAKNSISIVKWMDRKSIYIMSNFTDPTNMTKITRKLKNGQTIQYYAVDRKSRRNWLRIFFHFLNVVLSNAFVIYHRDHPDENMKY
jgi:hypothetical protein